MSWETAAFATGFVVAAVGAFSLLYPLRWIGLKTRGIALLTIASGFLIVALGAQMIDSYMVYLGLALAAVGFVSVLKPVRCFFIPTRWIALLVLGSGLLLSIGISVLPYDEKRAGTAAAKIDEWMPRWQVGERHAIAIAAPPEKVFAAIHDVRADEILLFRTLTAIRRCGQEGPENILNAPDQKPLLDVATETTFVLLDNDIPREIVVGSVIAAPRAERIPGRPGPALFREALRPGVVLATMNFVVTPNQAGSTVTTETRVYANTPAALRRFGVYWRLIHPGSDLIRRMWLRAIAQRAEKSETR
jgi:hypothetical protein